MTLLVQHSFLSGVHEFIPIPLIWVRVTQFLVLNVKLCTISFVFSSFSFCQCVVMEYQCWICPCKWFAFTIWPSFLDLDIIKWNSYMPWTANHYIPISAKILCFVNLFVFLSTFVNSGVSFFFTYRTSVLMCFCLK